MKMKKFLAAAATVAVAASAMSVFSAGTSAIGSDKIDFEDGDLSFVYLNTDADACVKSGLTVTDHNGSKQLTLPVANGEWAKIWFDLDSIMPRESATQIMSVTMDIQAAPEAPGATVNWKGGALGAAGGFDRENMTGEGFQVNPDWSQGSQFEIGAYNPDEESPVAEAEIKFLLPSSRITLEGTNPFIAVQVWQASDNGYILYIDNVVFTDKDGNAGVYISDYATIVPSDVGNGQVNFGSQNAYSAAFKDATAGYAGAVWYSQAAPEPTSGLLLLLGMAGLALKRKGA